MYKTVKFFQKTLVKYFSIIILIVSAYNNLYALDTTKETIDVGIILNVSDFTTGSSEDFFVSDALTKKLRLTRGNVKIFCSQKGVCIGKYTLSPPLKIEPVNGVIFANSKPYRGYLIVKKLGDKINIINVLPIEDYLKGVLPKETGIDWGIEALKTQAIVSRTYSIANLYKHSTQGFDICSTTHCQVYGGAEVESDLYNKAILETQCEVLTYKGEFAQTVFHANCGGYTENPKHIWNWKYTPPYLKGVKCGYCSDSPHANWESSIDENFIRKKILDDKLNVEKIKKIKVKGKTSSGAAKELEILHSKGKFLINAYQFRLAVDAWRIKSHTFNSIKTDGDKFYFKGKGWGHKVGLCQCGAKNMAEKGKTYKQILDHFYPGTKIEKVVYK